MRGTVSRASNARTRLLAMLLGFLCLAPATAAEAAAGPQPAVRTSAGLTAFRSDAELRAFLLKLRQPKHRGMAFEPVDVPAPPPPPAVSVASPAQIVVTGARVAAPGITNNQEIGVDEGDIVKLRGDTLVILRRGRLFTVSLAGGRMAPVDSIDAFPPGVDARSDWYDEMLLSGDRVIVVGYSYGRGGTEINRFRLDAAGHLRFEDATRLRSNDYYSSRNYASRLIGTKLIYYTPLDLRADRDPLGALPGVRRWRGKAAEGGFTRITGARRVYIAPAMRDRPGAQIDALHSVITCDLASAALDCSAVAVLGPASRTFYVSTDAVYLWISDAWSQEARRRGISSYIFRLPFGGERPSAIGARGAPVDQFAFREDPADRMLNVLVRAEGGGDAMFWPEASGGGVALLRVPLREFGDGSREAARGRYRLLPPAKGYVFHNRFVGDHVLYGSEDEADDDRPGDSGGRFPLVVAPVRGGAVARFVLPHAVGRIEALGRDALVVGEGKAGLSLSAVELGGGPRLGDRYTLPAASEGESRSHGFFFKPASADGASGVLGLPVAREAAPAYQRFFGSSAAMLFLERRARRFSPAGELAAHPAGVVDDACQASCVDWYGNARPIFAGDRTFALLGYELVEGAFSAGRIREVARIDFAPRARRGASR